VSFKPCIVIPVYNHGGAIHRTVSALSGYDLPIYLTDDGSDDSTRAALDRVKAAFPNVRISRFDINQGKGAAAMDAMRRAACDGCTHALQIDADAQHDAADVPGFLALARAHPEAIVSGKPIYDASVPRSRLCGRYITHFWVWIETLSFDIGDALCGYRLYPLAATIRLIDRARVSLRMDFDLDIIVRLYWAGVPVLNLPTRVTYPADGVSHFDLLRDNVRISRTHTRLFFGMLPRVPSLLWRKIFSTRTRSPDAAARETHWARTAERGTLFGLRILHAAYRILGRRVARILMLPVTAYFFATAGAARRASLQYLGKVFDRYGPLPDLPRAPGACDAFRHFQAFSESALDKLAAWHARGAELPVDFPAR
jgi:GT2 family glycosyltransferase